MGLFGRKKVVREEPNPDKFSLRVYFKLNPQRTITLESFRNEDCALLEKAFQKSNLAFSVNGNGTGRSEDSGYGYFSIDYLSNNSDNARFGVTLNPNPNPNSLSLYPHPNEKFEEYSLTVLQNSALLKADDVMYIFAYIISNKISEKTEEDLLGWSIYYNEKLAVENDNNFINKYIGG